MILVLVFMMLKHDLNYDSSDEFDLKVQFLLVFVTFGERLEILAVVMVGNLGLLRSSYYDILS